MALGDACFEYLAAHAAAALAKLVHQYAAPGNPLLWCWNKAPPQRIWERFSHPRQSGDPGSL